ncbi:uncharacterized protein HD556DRAFT_1437192 [Suillus plorans]|uniref:Uncharacterized protein n=1 Tax=Suillus plorans TaxID=116603 RepID=A0A9P7DWQ3_9AGAM|nr:uncharacterized protein HD556DRAFT_1437192 [Suillus plorans]KAG1805028.1 hypothetical protein HD556DRAFT_1437192 [Suillus plorans]
MSTPVQSSLAGLKASTAQLVGIIAGARHIPAGTVDVYLALTKQVTTLLGDIIQAHEKGDYIPGIVASCSKELMRVRSMTPQVLPDWHSVGHDDPRVLRHAWRKQVRTWEALGDNSCDLPVVPNPSTGPLTVNLPSPPVPSPTPVLPSPPVIAGNVASSSGKTTSEFRDKGKGKAVAVDLEPEVGGSSKRKSPMISGHSSQTPKSAMKGRKRVKSTRLAKSKPFVESEDDEDTIVQPISRGVPEVILPQLSTIVVRTPQLPRSPGSPKKQSFGPALLTASSRLEVMKSPISRPEAPATSSSHPEVVESSDGTSSTSDGEPPANPTFDITIPSPTNPCHYCVKEDWPCATRLDKRSGHPCLSCIRCSTKKIKCNPASLGSLPKRTRGKSTTGRTCSKTPAPAPSNAPSPLQSRARTCSQSRGPSCTPAIPAVTTPQVQSRGRSKTITAKKTPAPAPAPAPASVPSSSFAVPRAALDVPMPDLHSMAITIRDGAARIAMLEAHVWEQDDKIDTLQHLHESLRCNVVDQHPSFPLPDTPANATILLDQSSPPHPFMEPTPLTVEDGSAMVGLMVEPTQVQPEGPQSSGEIVVQDEPGNLLPEYNSSDEEMDVEVKVERPREEVEMAT